MATTLDEPMTAGAGLSLASEVLKWTPVVIVLLVILWAGSRGFWYFGPNVRAILAQYKLQRDQWRSLAIALLREKGIDVPLDVDDATTIATPRVTPPPDTPATLNPTPSDERY